MSRLVSWLARLGAVPRYEAAYEALDRLFKSAEDPWYFGSDKYETARFDKIVDVLRRVPHDSILEAGCAEGHLTRRLCEVSSDVTAFDVSPTAVERARQAAPRPACSRDGLRTSSSTGNSSWCSAQKPSTTSRTWRRR